MREHILVRGMILEANPINDYDKRLLILTRDRGKITVFARGVKRINSKLMAATDPFCFGDFKLYEGKNAYNLIDADIKYYFEELRWDFEGAFLGMYFLEYASWYARENNDDSELLKLLFFAIRAIIAPKPENKLVRAVFEIKILIVNGEFPGIPKNRSLDAATLYTLRYIEESPPDKVFKFTVSEKVMAELIPLADEYRKKFTDHHFKSLDTLDSM
ncbi:MAG: DNA repair protein RecO [Lachnospiraceae bacterium]|nr:DNA repair protein RecO [Lachnospiraceae bacterium]